MIVVTNPAQFAEYKREALLDLTGEMIEVHQRHIRNRFDDAKKDTTAQACIEMALTLGFTELASEMESDLECERLLATLTNY